MNADTNNGYPRNAVTAGYALAIVYAIHSAVTILMPRSDKLSPLRESLRSWHYLLGLILFGLLAWRVWLWFRDTRPAAPAGITPAGHAWARVLTISSYLVLLVMPLLGITSAWTDGLTVRLGPFLSLPALVGENRSAWMFSGYFHSALSFGVMLLTVGAVLTGAWFKLRRGVGLLRAFPPGFGLQVWAALGITVYAFSTFRGPGPGNVAIAGYLGLTALVWGIGTLIHRGKAPVRLGGSAGAVPRVAAVAVVLLLLALGSYGPYQMFRVVPWPIGEAVEAAEGVTSHDQVVTTVTVTPETDFEKQVAGNTFKWCGFCHTFTKGGKHLVGPNLYGIFGQQAGTVPNFYYSTAMADAGRKGLVWTDETLDQFIAGPDQFLPGTSMIISIGPVKTAEERAAVINLLKKATMPAEAITTAAAP